MAKLHSKTIEKGFTLVELLVVVVIIGILVAIAIPVYNNTAVRANRKAVETNLRTIDGVIMQYGAIKEGAIPASKGDLYKYFDTWPAGPDGVEYDISDGRAVISKKGDGDWFTAAEGDSLPITWKAE